MGVDPSRAERPRSRRGRFIRRALVGLLLSIGALGIGSWIGRDLPRRWLERRLADELDAEVRLGRLEVDGSARFILSGLDVRRPSWEPRLERVTVERLEVLSPLGQILSNRFDRLAADGVEVRLAPPLRPAEPVPASDVFVGTLDVRRGRVVASGPSGESGLDFSVHVRDWGAEPAGEVTASSTRLDLAPWLALLGEANGGALRDLRLSAESPHLEVVLARGPEFLRVDGRGGPLTAGYGAQGIRVSHWTLAATAGRASNGGPLRIDAFPSLPGVESALVVAELDPETFELERGRASLSGIVLETLLDGGATLPDGFKIEGLARLEAGTEDGSVFDCEADARIDRLELPLAGGRLESREASVSATGTWRRGERRIVPLRAHLSVMSGRGSFGRGGVVPPEFFPLELVAEGELLLETAPGYSGKLALRSPGGGELEAAGTIQPEAAGASAKLRWSWSRSPGLAALRASAARLGLTLPAAVAVDGVPHAAGTLEGPLADPVLRGRLDLDELGIAADVDTGTRGGGRWSLAHGTAHADFSRATGDGARVSLDALELRGDLRHDAPAGAGETWSRPLVATARGALDAAGGVEIDETTAAIEGLARARLRGSFDGRGAIAASASFEAVELARLRDLARLWVTDPAPEYELKGTLAAEIGADRSPDGRFGARGTLDLAGMGFSSVDGSRVVEGAGARWSFDVAGGTDASLEGRAHGALTGPLLLWGTLFGDYSALESQADLTVERRGDGWESTLDLGLPREVRVLGRLASNADASSPARDRRALEYGLSVDLPDLGAFLESFVRGPFEGSVAGIDTLEASGALKLDLAGELSGARRSARGSLDVSRASFSGAADGASVTGLELALPFDLEWLPDDPDSSVDGPERAGSLAVEHLRLAGVDFPPVRTALAVAGDSVRLDRPQRLALLGGHADLQQLALVDWSRASRHLRFGLVLDDLDLGALSAALGTFPLEGRVDGFFPAVRLTPERLQVDGGGGIDVFGGRVEIFDISGSEVLGRFPRFAFSARFDGIRLLDVTRTVDFGEVEGVVRGEIRDCELFRGTPVRCAADLRSVDTPGVPQRIDVKAIRNISILGSGSRVGLLDRGLQSFFDRYTYASIGIEMRLDSDRFLLRGTERRGEKELFVKGRLPFRIDIVNVAPGHAVSFQTMLGRLGNLEVRKTPPPKKSREETD